MPGCLCAVRSFSDGTGKLVRFIQALAPATVVVIKKEKTAHDRILPSVKDE
ncbi:MAG: hypothetical protein IJZ80_10010 [Clostridia bacterium]|nr:hypothetical protein [Clostridia bacterium]